MDKYSTSAEVFPVPPRAQFLGKMFMWCYVAVPHIRGFAVNFAVSGGRAEYGTRLEAFASVRNCSLRTPFLVSLFAEFHHFLPECVSIAV